MSIQLDQIMPPPQSDIFVLQDIPGAGRGLVATKDIEQGTTILACNNPAINVIFREYRKEVCAYCFKYDRGRTLPIRNHEIGKVFCTENCQQAWHNQQGALGLEASQSLETFIKANSKHARDFTQDMLSGPRPTQDVIALGWQNADSKIGAARLSQRNLAGASSQAVYADVLASELASVLLHHGQPDVYESEVKPLEVDLYPYKSLAEAEVTWNSLIQLSHVLPEELRPSCKSSVSQRVTAVGNHNAFGIRAGGEDNEEYMGWAIYPEASYFNHSCIPNLAKKRDGRSWHFTANRDIVVGEQLCISYLGGEEKDLSVQDRGARLQSAWHFTCMCSRCIDEAS